MNYHPDDFLALVEEVERQGGSHLNEACKPSHFRLNLPIDEDKPQGPRVNRRLSTTGCRRHAKFLVAMLPDAYFDLVDVFDTEITTDIKVSQEGEVRKVVRRASGEDFDFDDSENPNSAMADGSPALATCCAVDDAMGLWPRFNGAMHTGESFQEGL